ncbi:MAG TPA: CHAD domain-containing protein [Ktedonosporobacter sp.]|nr:CHAD domain-containing protein [Ktedonosporobacter sp.]
MAKARPITNLDTQAPTGTNARVIARTRLEELYEWDKYVDDPYQVHELHNLRIAAKRLRYTLEIFAPVLPEACSGVLREVEQIQEELGELHDSDVMVALLRLCLGSLDSGVGYEDALVKASYQQGKGRFLLNPDMAAYLLNPASAPSAGQRQGLEYLLLDLQKKREEQYAAFRQHWYQLQARDFRREVLTILDT